MLEDPDFCKERFLSMKFRFKPDRSLRLVRFWEGYKKRLPKNRQPSTYFI